MAPGKRERKPSSSVRLKLQGNGWTAKTRDGDVVLLKASRGVKLEKALEVWQSRRDGTK